MSDPIQFSTRTGALDGIRVLDITRALAGPWCSQNLGDLGAHVIKVERPDSGDDSRSWGPPWLGSGETATAESAYFLCCNRNKKSVTIDLATPQGQEEVRTLVRNSDVVIENYKVGQLQKFGLDYESLRPLNPGLVYCSISGFGQDGPWAHRPGYDFVGQGLSGFMSITGERDGLPGAGPQKAGVAIADLFTGMYSTIAILAALRHRDRSGEGQHIDISLLDCIVAVMANQSAGFLASGQVPQRFGNAHQSVVPYGVFQASDGHLILAIGNDSQFKKFCEVVDRKDLALDERFLSNAQRVVHRTLLIPEVEIILKQTPRDLWIERFEKVGVPCAPILNIAEALHTPQIKARDLCIDMPHASGVTAKLVGSPMKMSATPPTYRLAPPLLGQHNLQVLGRL